MAEVNRVVRGWGAYFRVGNAARKFDAVDRYVYMRLGRFLAKKTRRSCITNANGAARVPDQPRHSRSTLTHY